MRRLGISQPMKVWQLVELLKRAGAPVGEKLRGATMASYVLAEAKDGYRVVFALPGGFACCSE